MQWQAGTRLLIFFCDITFIHSSLIQECLNYITFVRLSCDCLFASPQLNSNEKKKKKETGLLSRCKQQHCSKRLSFAQQAACHMVTGDWSFKLRLEGDFSHKYAHRQLRGWACLEAWCTVPRLCYVATLQIIYKHFPTVWQKKLCVWHLTSESKSKHTRLVQNLEVLCLCVHVWKGSSYIKFIYCYVSSIQCDCQECKCVLCCSFSNSQFLICVYGFRNKLLAPLWWPDLYHSYVCT